MVDILIASFVVFTPQLMTICGVTTTLNQASKKELHLIIRK